MSEYFVIFEITGSPDATLMEAIAMHHVGRIYPSGISKFTTAYEILLNDTLCMLVKRIAPIMPATESKYPLYSFKFEFKIIICDYKFKKGIYNYG